jgi:hypothetical protein
MSEEQNNEYMLYLGEEQTGPYDLQQIKKMLEEKKVLPSSLVWREGLEDWVSVSDIIAQDEPADATEQPEAPEKPTAPPVTSSGAENDDKHLTFAEKLATSGKITGAQAKLEKLRRMNLPTAYRKLGEAAYSIKFDGSTLQEQYASIDTLKQQIDDLKKSPVLDGDATTMDKAKQQGTKAKQAIEAERMTHKLNGVFEAIGATVSQLPMVPDSLQDGLQQVRMIEQQVEATGKELEELRGKVTGVFARPSRVLIPAAIAIALFVGWKTIVPRYQSWKYEAEAAKDQKIAEAQIAGYEAESKRLEMEGMQADKKMREQARVEAAQRELEKLAEQLKRQERETVAELERERAEQERELERARAEAERGADLAKRERDKMIEADKAKEAAKIAQADREALASQSLSVIPLTPSSRIAGNLAQIGASIEMRGKNIDKLIKLQADKSWLEMLAEMSEIPLSEYPDANKINREVDGLWREDFQILLKTRFKESRNAELYFVRFPKSYNVMDYSQSWTVHPDGIGYTHRWSPEDGPVIIAIGNYKSVGEKLRNMQNGFSSEMRALQDKKDLGELSEDAYETSLKALHKRAVDSVSGALGVR